MASKKFKGKTCAYCARPGLSQSNDHVLAESFFLPEDRVDLPQVPACTKCNNRKSRLELLIGSTLLVGSQHPDAQRYRRELVRPRLDRNPKLRRKMGMHNPPRWVRVNGVMQLMHEIKVTPSDVSELVGLIVRGLHMHHFGEALPQGFLTDARMFSPDDEGAMWSGVVHYFPSEQPRVVRNIGRGAFVYNGVQSPAHPTISAWEIWWHGGIRLHGQDGSADRWWCITGPSKEYLESLADDGHPDV